MPPESTTDVEASGTDVPSILRGFAFLGMLPKDQSVARALVDEIVERNSVKRFEWYKPAGTNELACYWDGSQVNLMWITPGHVHVRANGPVVGPERPADWSKANGEWVGWTLPSFAGGGTSSGADRPRVVTVSCPRHLAPPQPAGAECPECCEVH